MLHIVKKKRRDTSENNFNKFKVLCGDNGEAFLVLASKQGIYILPDYPGQPRQLVNLFTSALIINVGKKCNP